MAPVSKPLETAAVARPETQKPAAAAPDLLGLGRLASAACYFQNYLLRYSV